MSTIKDVIQLSHKHNIENKLYNSDVLDKIYKINGDGRVIKFFVKLYDEKLEKEALWKRLLHSLKKISTFRNKILQAMITPVKRIRTTRPNEKQKTHIHHNQN